MAFAVTWHPDAENELAAIWLKAADRAEVAAAANVIERLLSSHPHTIGESFYGDRMLVEPPLAMTYTIRDADRLVQVLQVWHQSVR